MNIEYRNSHVKSDFPQSSYCYGQQLRGGGSDSPALSAGKVDRSL